MDRNSTAGAPREATGVSNEDVWIRLAQFMPPQSRPLPGAVKQAAENGLPFPMLAMAVAHVDSDREEGRSWLRRLREHSEGRAMAVICRSLAGLPPRLSRPVYEALGELGDSDAIREIGTRLWSADPEASRAWLEYQAAVGNDPTVAFVLGAAVAQSDPEVARHLWEKASRGGSVDAMFSLGVSVLANDRGSARRYFEQAAEQGDATSMFNLGRMAEQDGNEVEARDWYERAVEAGSANAMYNLGLAIQKQEPQRSATLFERAAAAGHIEGTTAWGAVLLASGDPSRARSVLKTAARSGYVRAMIRLARLEVTERNFDEAEAWYRQAAHANDPTAMVELGQLLVKRKRPHEAKQLFSEAVKHGHQGAARPLRWLNRLGISDEVPTAKPRYRTAVVGPVKKGIQDPAARYQVEVHDRETEERNFHRLIPKPAITIVAEFRTRPDAIAFQSDLNDAIAAGRWPPGEASK